MNDNFERGLAWVFVGIAAAVLVLWLTGCASAQTPMPDCDYHGKIWVICRSVA